MTGLGKTLGGVPPAGVRAWVTLAAEFDRLADRGRKPVCTTHPEDWASDAPVTVRREAAAACGHCPVLALCRDYGRRERQGVWGAVDRTPAPAKRTEAAA